MLKEDQIKGAPEKITEKREELILLLADGNIERAYLVAGQTVYKATPFMLRRLRVEKVPSIVTQKERKLRVREIVLK